jgi:N-methylhydantoinase B
VLGGTAARPCHTHRIGPDGSVTVLPAFCEEVIAAGTRIAFTACGGGGYGDPALRDPERVAATVNRGWLSRDLARSAYRVELAETAEPGVLAVDARATARLRG